MNITKPPLGPVPYLPTHNHFDDKVCEPGCPVWSWNTHVERYGNPYDLAEQRKPAMTRWEARQVEGWDDAMRAALDRLKEQIEALKEMIAIVRDSPDTDAWLRARARDALKTNEEQTSDSSTPRSPFGI